MNVSIIVAVSENYVIGDNNTLLWHLSEDLKRFKNLTMGHAIIMGRKTHESIGKALPGRTNVVITRQQDYKAAEGCIVVNSIGEAFEKLEGEEEVFIIGGEEIYKMVIHIADKMYITQVEGFFVGDAVFPKFRMKDWKILNQKTIGYDEKNPYQTVFYELERVY